MSPRPGDAAPAFSAPDATGRTWTEKDLAGRPYVVTFYPKDETAGCIAQVCGFRDVWQDFADLGIHVLAVSRDDVDSHAAFAKNRRLPYALLSDTDASMHKAYAVGRIFGATRRKSFLVGPDGVILDAYESNFRPQVHAERMLKSAKRALPAKEGVPPA